MEKCEGTAINGEDDHWTVNCPECEKEYEYKGFFDSSDITECRCGCKFTTSKVWIGEKHYLK